MPTCKVCGNKAYSDYCFQHKPRKPIGQKADKPLKKPKPIKPISDKRKKQEAAYSVLRKAFLEQHPNCEICGSPSTEVHHRNGRENERLNDTEYWMAIDRLCHTELHLNPQWARDNGYLI